MLKNASKTQADRFDVESKRMLHQLFSGSLSISLFSTFISLIALAIWTDHALKTKAIAKSINLIQLFGSSDAHPEILLVILILFWIGIATITYQCAKRFLLPVRRESQLIRQFTQDSGHELATPIAVMRSQLELLERDMENGGSGSKHLPGIMESSVVLSKLVDDLRFLSRSENPYLEHQIAIVSLDKLIKSIIASKTEDFEKRNMRLSTGRVEPLVIMVDKEGLERAVSNLLSNALRYGKEGGTTTLSVYKENGAATLVVKDDGLGIAEDKLENIFERFYSADRKRSEEHKGSGLGLSIVKAVVDAHGGEISVKSKLGEGTEFTLTLPLAPSQHPLLKLTNWK